MSKRVKIALISVGSLLLMAVAGLWYASSTIDPAQLVKLLAGSVKNATGRDLKISGPVTLRLFPSIAVSAEQVSLSNAPWATESDMLKLQHIELDIKILPLLSKRIEIDSVNLSGLELYLRTNSAGKANWDMGSAPSANSSLAISPAQDDATSDSFISLKNVAMQNANIHYQDASGEKTNYQVQRLALSDGGDKTAITLAMKYNSVDIGLTGKAGSLSEAYKEWGASDNKVPVDLVLSLNGKTLQIKGDISKNAQSMTALNLALSSKLFEWPNFSNPAVGSSGPGQASTHRSSSSSRFLFSDETLPLDSLPQAMGNISVNIDQLSLPKRKPLQNLTAQIQLKGDVIEISQGSFQLGGGRADIQGRASQFSGPAPSFALKGVTQNFTLEGLMASLDPSSKVSGGNMKLAFDLKSTGKSLHQLAGNSSGKIQLSIDQATMGSNFLNDAGDFVMTVLDSMNPLRKKSSNTVLECSVAYLPINNGQINIANTVGTETDRLKVVMAGSINLKTEAVNLTINPQEKSGLTTGLDLAGLVKVGGTLSSPQAVLNQAGVVNSAVSIGLGILTGGATLLAENARSLTSKTNPCKDALRPWAEIYPGAN
ncbi:AsmA family protein [Polynucleobacter sp. AP-Nino-20-G2]|uniref:AsmA family protein n=1 Tax=Polynucleobacter sp. AP-Nino-20-G2 TaxID=2576917 RepID=UPI001BFED7C7|nr:AsmA family protein [Polynucleobacter sp. AP-Nino-20-G2]QWE17176.1 AsmA family protein [Polynucleobacter sp. AP-Nino-20-G2]